LHDTLLTFELPAFAAKLRVRERKHPKLYWADPGLPRAMRRESGPPGSEERGHLFEGWLVSLLRAYRDYRGLFEDWSYWAPGKGSSVEVDLLLRRGKDLVALEFKPGRIVRDSDLRGLRAIAELPRVGRRIVVFTGERPMATEDRIEILPVREFLHEVESGELMP
jgi:predicted AAA+ superfamily ATPase